MFDGIEAPVLVGGHTHLQMIRRYEDAVIVNPGSVGLPFKEWWPRPIRIAAWAEYGILTRDEGQLSIDLRRTPFDVDAFLEHQPGEWDAARRLVDRLLGAGVTALYRKRLPQLDGRLFLTDGGIETTLIFHAASTCRCSPRSTC